MSKTPFRGVLFCVTLLLCAFSQPARAAIIGYDDFLLPSEGSQSYGWDYGSPGSASAWDPAIPGGGSVSAPTTYFRYFGSNTEAAKVTTGPIIAAFNFQLASDSANSWTGLSMFSDGSEIKFFGKPDGSAYYGIAGANSTVPLDTAKHYVVAAGDYSQGKSFLWIYNEGQTPKYADMLTPAATGDWTNAGINRVRIAGGTTATYSELTVATAYADIFGTAPKVTQLRESFSSYTDNNITGQYYRNLGQKPLTTWSRGGIAADATINNNKNLVYAAPKDPENLWSSDAGVLSVNNSSARMDIDPNIVSQWGLMGTDGKVGGNGVDGSLFVGFLVQYAGNATTLPNDISGNYSFVQLNDGGDAKLSLTKYAGAWAYSGIANGNNFDIGNPYLWANADTHLIVAKVDYTSGADSVTVWLDPDLTKSWQAQTGYKSTMNNLSLAFDNITFLSDTAFDFDEFRMAGSWSKLTGYSNQSPACFREGFNGYTAGPANDKPYLRPGEAYGGKWAGSGTFDSTRNLVYEKGGWGSKTGLLESNGGDTTMLLDPRMVDEWGLLDSNGVIGGSDVSGTLYYGFLVQAPGELTSGWSGGAQLFRNGSFEVLGIGQLGNMSTFSGFSHTPVGNFDLGETIDGDVHLILAKITYNENALDDLSIWFDPDLGIFEDPDALVYSQDSIADLTFDAIRFRNSNTWLYDEFRMAPTWALLSNEVPEPATWTMLLLGAAAMFVARFRRKQS